jgi:3-oxoisoapionate kinase
MSAETERSRPPYGWYGDDFTGATDTLATWAERGFRALLFLRVPTPAHVAAAGALDAIGIAGATRALAPDAAADALERAGCFFAGQGVDLLHYKCCSTFDSAPHVGSIGAAVQTLHRYFPNPFVPIIGGQPNLDRYCLFGTLFAAAGTGGEVHRIDRHPTMSVHPVTPMAEADLRKHLAAQGLNVGLVDYRGYESGAADAALDACTGAQPDAVLFDVACAADLAIIGRLIMRRMQAGPMLAVGPSSVAQALAATDDGDVSDRTPPTAARHNGPTLALVGSLSPVTRAQVEAATGYRRLDIDPGRLLKNENYADTLRDHALALMSNGNVMLVTERPSNLPTEAARVAVATGALLRDILSKASIARLVIAGGDTSSHAVAALDVWGLSYRGSMAPGAPLCRVHSDDTRLDGLDIILKGGQMGSREFFEEARGRDVQIGSIPVSSH